MNKKKILILGGGFGGMYAALRLEKTLARDADVDVTDIVTPLRAMLRRVKFFAGEVESIDPAAKRVTVSHGYEQHGHTLSYDYLLLAMGSTTNFFKLPGVQEQAITMKSLGDAI